MPNPSSTTGRKTPRKCAKPQANQAAKSPLREQSLGILIDGMQRQLPVILTIGEVKRLGLELLTEFEPTPAELFLIREMNDHHAAAIARRAK